MKMKHTIVSHIRIIVITALVTSNTVLMNNVVITGDEDDSTPAGVKILNNIKFV